MSGPFAGLRVADAHDRLLARWHQTPDLSDEVLIATLSSVSTLYCARHGRAATFAVVDALRGDYAAAAPAPPGRGAVWRAAMAEHWPLGAYAATLLACAAVTVLAVL